MYPVAVLSLAALLALPEPAAAGFAPGEETVFDVRYLKLRAGEGRILVGQAEGDVWPVIFQARTQGVGGIVDVREHLVSYWDQARQVSRGSDLRAYEVGDLHHDSTRFDRENGTATITVERKGKKKVKTVDVPADVHELTSAFIWLRLRPIEVGQRFEVPVLSGNKPFTLVVEAVGREQIDTPAGTFATLKLRMHIQIEGKFATDRESWMWLSDDPRHVLVKASADFAIGSMVLELKRYTPGVPATASAR
jgi:hypothetical protein